MMTTHTTIRVSTVFGTVITTLFFSPIMLQAQVLEEIIVTAQRRTQSLQDVPISVELFDSDTIREQGFRDMSYLADFSPGVIID